MIIFGTRPEAIKFIPVIKKIVSDKINFDLKICVSAQHRNMLDEVLNNFGIKPDYDLNIMSKNQTLSEINSKISIELEKIFKKEKFNLVLVQGDTNTAFIGALTAFYNRIKIAHVEAGLRSFNKFEPFPEEINRKFISQLADINFAPTQQAKKNLLAENIQQENIFVTGNTVIDCINLNLKKDYLFENRILKEIDFADKKNKFILVTAHRRENFGVPLKNICQAILKLSEDKNLKFIYAVHPNPNVKDVVYNILGGKENIYLTEPLNIKDLHNLISKVYLVMTDSGGLQEEVPSFNKPVLVLRNVTERQEGLLTGALKLIGTDENKIIESVKKLIENDLEYKIMCKAKNPFGDGKSADRIYRDLLFYFDPINNKAAEDFIFEC